MKALARLRRRRERIQRPKADVTSLTPSEVDPPSITTPTLFSPSPSTAPPTTRSASPAHHTSSENEDSSPLSTAATVPQPPTAVLDGRGQITFNLHLLTDQGIVICPGFHRDQQVFTSTDLLSAVRPSSSATHSATEPQPTSLPAFRAKADVETAYSPTSLPSLPGSKGEDGSTAAPTSASSISDELTIAFANGAFSLVDLPATTPAASTSSSTALDTPSSFLTTASQTTTAAATAALRRLALTSWRSSNTSPVSVASTESENAAFPPTSALPPAAQAEEDTSSSFEEEEADATAGLYGDHKSVNVSATKSVGLDIITPKTSDMEEGQSSTPNSVSNKPDSVEERTADSSAVSTSTVISRQPTTTTPSPASSNKATSLTVANPVSASTAASSSPSFSPFSLPGVLLSSVTSWLFPATPPQQPADTTPTAAAPTPPPPSPSPPPPYAATLHRIVIIGVHGWSLFGGILGDKPLLVSSRFCYYIQHALLRYMRTLSAGGTQPPLHITCIPLYGHGRVEDRVSMYVESQLPQYADELRQADHVIIACHSQGCMVTSSLLALLLLNPNPPLALPAPPHISILMLAGLHHGPFPDLPTDMYPPTKELLSYSHFYSSHSQLHIERMHRLLAAGVRVMLVGSVHDAVVPLYSSLGQLLGRSSNLTRAMYVDYQHYQPDFLYSFLSLALYLSNRPPTQHQPPGSAVGSDVLTHLSGFLRGSLLEKAGGAHSAMHRLVDVYGLAVEWAMSGPGEVSNEVTASGSGTGPAGAYSGVMWSSHLTDGFTLSKLNRHLLGWSVRGMMTELDGRRGEKGLDVEEEKRRLTGLFVEWAPRSKNLRALRETLAVVFDNNRAAGAQIQSNL